MLQKPSKHKVNKTQHGGYGWEHLQYFCIKLKSVWPLRDTVACISWTDRATVKSLIGLETSRLKNLWLLLCWCFQNGSDKWHIYFTKKPSNSALSKGCTICFIALSDLNRVTKIIKQKLQLVIKDLNQLARCFRWTLGSFELLQWV